MTNESPATDPNVTPSTGKELLAQLIVAVHQMRDQLDRIESSVDLVRRAVVSHGKRISDIEHIIEAA